MGQETNLTAPTPTTSAPAPSMGGGQTLDPKITSLVDALADQESSGGRNESSPNSRAEGSIGLLQYTPDRFNNDAQMYLGGKNLAGQPLDINSDDDQRLLKYTEIAAKKSQGVPINTIIAAHNWQNAYNQPYDNVSGQNSQSGAAYNVSNYVDSVYNDYKQRTANLPADTTAPPTADTSAPEEGVGFINSLKGDSPAYTPSEGDGFLDYALKTLGNVPGNTVGLAKDLYNVADHPINNFVKPLGEAAAGGLWEAAGNGPDEKFDALKSNIANAAEHPLDTFEKNPVTSLLNISGAGDAVAGAADLAGATDLAKAASGVADATNPINLATGGLKKVASVIPGAQKIGDAVGATAKYATSAVTGMPKDLVESLVNNPTIDFTKAPTGQDLVDSVDAGFQKLNEDLTDAKKFYPDQAGTSGAGFDIGKVIDEVGPKFGLEKDADTGLFKWTPNSALDEADVADVNNLLEKRMGGVQPDTQVPFQQFHGARRALDKLSGYNPAKKSVDSAFTGAVRKGLSTQGDTAFSGLAQGDAKFAQAKTVVDAVSKAFYQNDPLSPNFKIPKEGAINKIINSVNPAKQGNDLSLLEAASPGITPKIMQAKVRIQLEDLMGNKVGTYTRGIINAGAAAGVGTSAVTMNIPGVIGSLATMYLTQPTVAATMIQYTGRALQAIAKVKPGTVVTDAMLKTGILNQAPLMNVPVRTMINNFIKTLPAAATVSADVKGATSPLDKTI